MKKSKIFFIITAVFIVITIGTFFYKNSCEEKSSALLEDTPENNKAAALDIALEGGIVTQAEASAIMDKRNKIYENEKTSKIIFAVSIGITVVMLVVGIVFKVKEKGAEK